MSEAKRCDFPEHISAVDIKVLLEPSITPLPSHVPHMEVANVNAYWVFTLGPIEPCNHSSTPFSRPTSSLTSGDAMALSSTFLEYKETLLSCRRMTVADTGETALTIEAVLPEFTSGCPLSSGP